MENNSSQKVCEQFETINNRIDINKTSSFQTSEIFMNKLIKELQPYHNEIYGTLEPFCDDREQGLMLSIYNQLTDDVMHVWCCEDKVKKDLMIVTGRDKTKENLYIKTDKDSIQYFLKSNYDEAINYSLAQVDKFLDKGLNLKI